jgi:hypothetical protein
MAKKANIAYLLTISFLMLIAPVISSIIEVYSETVITNKWDVAGKWFVFWGLGVRLFTAGLRQAIRPEFTAKEIFNIAGKESFLLIKELGLSNLCLGVVSMLALFNTYFCKAGAISGGLYLGIAGIEHIIKKPASINETVAMISDLFIMAVMILYLLNSSWM